MIWIEKEQEHKLQRDRCLNQAVFVFLDLSHTFIITCNSSKISARSSVEGVDASGRHRFLSYLNRISIYIYKNRIEISVIWGSQIEQQLSNKEPSFLQGSLGLIFVDMEFVHRVLGLHCLLLYRAPPKW